ncbi:50S ribosomal protein L25 [Paenibacillus thermotolerans]|uniref:50S ribosomal protein L25 n=1 Tax=Paenibacillus thermotolerans TaxID=3027807 RepID=UPI002368780F|nr:MULTISPECIES: 50S ribosomal protein L25 [unclassified Paenibacillus]
MTIRLQANKRTHLNASGLKNLRKSGRLPSVVFGKNADNEMIHISTSQFQKWLRQGGSGVIELQVEGSSAISVLLEDFQRDPRTREPIHVDFQRVQTNTMVRTKIPVKFKGTPIGTKQGGIVQIQSSFIEVEALPQHLPPEIEMDISAMNVGDAVLVKDVEFSAEVTVVSEPHEFLLNVVK